MGEYTCLVHVSTKVVSPLLGDALLCFNMLCETRNNRQKPTLTLLLLVAWDPMPRGLMLPIKDLSIIVVIKHYLHDTFLPSNVRNDGQGVSSTSLLLIFEIHWEEPDTAYLCNCFDHWTYLYSSLSLIKNTPLLLT